MSQAKPNYGVRGSDVRREMIEFPTEYDPHIHNVIGGFDHSELQLQPWKSEPFSGAAASGETAGAYRRMSVQRTEYASVNRVDQPTS